MLVRESQHTDILHIFIIIIIIISGVVGVIRRMLTLTPGCLRIVRINICLHPLVL